MRFTDIFGNAKFIAPSDAECEAPYIRKTFTASKPEKAEITICGLGFFELYINGRRVGYDRLVPANSLYCKRVNANAKCFNYDEFTYRTYAVVYDLAEYICDGENVLVVQLANGWFGNTGDHDQGFDYYGSVKLAYKLTVTDADGEKTIVSDETHKWCQSYILKSRLYLGEEQDMRMYDERILRSGYDDSEWKSVAIADIHESEYDIQNFEPDRVTETRVPAVVKDFGDYTVYDAGINMTGYVVVSCERAGEKIEVRHAEELDENGNLYTVTCAADRKPQLDTYISDGVHEMYPRYLWHGFRYFSVSNNARPVKACMLHADIDVTSHFTSDSEMLNWIYETYLRTQLENMHCGVPSDCPTRERLGYTGDGQLCADAAMTLLDGAKFYKKWMQDIVDSQCRVTGHVNNTCPYLGGGGGIGGWGSAIIHVPYAYYKTYGDDTLIKQHFARMLSFMRYLDSRCSAGFITSDVAGNWNLGDWGFSKSDEYEIPQNYVNTYFYIKDLCEMTEMAKIVGREDIIPSYLEKIEVSKRAMRGAYLSSQNGNFFGDYQGANCFAVDLGIGDERTYANMCKKYSEKPEYDTGIFATDLITKLFIENGNAQIAFDMLTSKGELTFHNMKKHGATTLWEYMWGHDAELLWSHNHPMFGAVTRYLFTGFLGITQREGSCGYRDLVIKPSLVDGMNYCSGDINVGSGKIAVEIKRDGAKTTFKIEIPQGVKAVFSLDCEECELACGLNTVEKAC